jgi:membrane-bound lytic murein transglycosylase B
MIARRGALAAPLILTLPAAAQSGSFAQFLSGVRAEALRRGVRPATIDRAFAGLRPNDRVIDLDRRQATGRADWLRIKSRYMEEQRLAIGRRHFAEVRTVLGQISDRFDVSERVIMGIWGAETGFGTFLGGHKAIEALATLAWEGRRGAYFRSELLAALRILDEGHIALDRMVSSWAGALGQPQFMPTNFFRLAVDFDGDGRRDIWDSRPDALASIANYLKNAGWRGGETWGRQVMIPPGLASRAGDRRTVNEWSRAGVRTAAGTELPRSEIIGELLVPEDSGEAYLVYHNFSVIRRYNTPYWYGLSVGLIGDAVTGAGV